MSAQAIKTRPIGENNVTPKQKQIISLHKQHPNASGREIARRAGTDPSYTIGVLQRYGFIDKNIQDYKAHRADILAGLQQRIISSITTKDIEKAPVGSRILAIAQLYDKERLERGLSNAEQPIMIIVKNSVQVEGPAASAPEDGKLVDITPGDKALHHVTP